MGAGTGRAIVLRILCAVAILFLGLGHQPLGLPQRQGYDAAAYVLPDGSQATLCVTVGDDNGKPAALKSNCEVCRLAASVMLPVPDADAWIRHHFASLLNPPRTDAAVVSGRAAFRPNSRAPPAFV